MAAVLRTFNLSRQPRLRSVCSPSKQTSDFAVTAPLRPLRLYDIEPISGAAGCHLQKHSVDWARVFRLLGGLGERFSDAGVTSRRRGGKSVETIRVGRVMLCAVCEQ